VTKFQRVGETFACLLFAGLAGCSGGQAGAKPNLGLSGAGNLAPGVGGNTAAMGTGGSGLLGSGGNLGSTGAAGNGPGPLGGSGGTTDLGTGGVGPLGTGGVTGPGAGGVGAGGQGGASGPSNPGEPCTGKPGGHGNETRTWNNTAQYIVHFPAGLDPNTPVPLVYVAHGFTMSGALMQSLTGFDAVADANKFVVVYPDGDGGATPWNVGAGACLPGAIVDAPAADSFGYLMAIRAEVEANQCINAKQIFITGFSMGGYFSNNVACQLGNTLVRASGPHSGGTYEGSCPGAPVPMFIMHGDADTFIDYTACGKGARDYWLARNKCGTEFETKPVMGGSCDWYKGCDPNGQTVFCSFNGVAHAWAGGATDAVWSFFKGYL